MSVRHSSFRVLRGLLAIPLVLAGCAQQPRHHANDSFDRIDRDLQTAVDSHAGKPAASGAKATAADALLPPLAMELPKPAAAVVEPRFDLTVSNAPAAQVFMAIVSGTRYSMLLPADLAGTLSVSLKDVTVPEALEAIRELYGYDFRVSGTRVYVQPNTLQTRVFQVNYLAGRRQGMSDLRVTTSSISAAQAPGGSAAGQPAPGTSSTRLGADSSRVSTSTDNDFWADLKAALGALVGSEGGRSVVLNPSSGVIVVRGMPQDIRGVERYLQATQLVIERQVMLEAKIIEVALNDEFQSGVNWAHFGGVDRRFAYGVMGSQTTLDTTGPIANTNVAALPGARGALATSAVGNGFVGLALQTNNFAGLLKFLETQGNVQVLSSPRIATLNNQKAVLKVGSDEFFVTNVTTTTSSTTTGSTTSPTITLQPFFSGIALDVTPQIDDLNNIMLHVHPSISVVAEKQKQIDLGTLGQFNLPLATSTVNETDSIVRVQDGNIVAIGGLMRQQQSAERVQVPGLGDVGGIGALFGQRSKVLRKSELVVLIKPTIIQGAQDWARDVRDTQARLREYDPRRDREAEAAER